MQKAAAILLILLAAVILLIYGTVMLRLPILDFMLRPFGAVLYVDPVGPPVWAAVFLIAGLFLLRCKKKPMPSASRQ